MTWLRAVLDQLCRGAAAVFWRVVEWPGRADTWRATGGRWAWLAFCGWGAYRMWQHAIPARVLLVLALGVAAWRTGGAAPTAEQPDEEQDQEQDQEPEPLDDAERRERLLDLARDLIGDRNGTHITALLAAAAEHQLVPAGTTGAALRRQLADWGVRTRDSLKVGGSVAAGLHADDLPDPSDPLPRYPDGSYVVG